MKQLNLKRKLLVFKKSSMYDKVTNYFKSFDLVKLQLLGEDNSNYDGFMFQGYLYKPKSIKVEYLGNKKIKGELKLKNKSIRIKNNSCLRSKNISFRNPIFENTEIIPKIKHKRKNKNNDHCSFLDATLSVLPKIKKTKNDDGRITDNINIIEDNNNNIMVNNAKYKYFSSHRSNSSNNNNSNSYLKSIRSNSKYITFYNLKNKLKQNIALLEKKVNISNKFIENGSKINEDEKPQFEYRFNNLKYHFSQFMD